MKVFIAILFLATLLMSGAYAYTLTISFYNIIDNLPFSGVFVYLDSPTLPLSQWGPSDSTGRVIVPDYSVGTYYWDLPTCDEFCYVEWMPSSMTFEVVISDEQLIVYGFEMTVDYPPDPPSDLIAQALPGNQIALTWNDNSDYETGFIIDRRMENTDWEFLADVAMDTQSYLDSGLTPGVTYYYRVYAYGFGDSDYSNSAHATSALLPGPANLQITHISSNQYRLDWSAAVNCTYYKVYAAYEPLFPTSSDWTYIGQTANLFFPTTTNAQKIFYLVKGVDQ